MLSLILDILVLIGLALTIYYCIRLSKSLSNFRQYRQEFNVLLKELSANIEKAQDAVANLKDTSYEAGEDLQKVINNSRNLSDELQLMNDMGNALANRLERLSEKGRTQVNGTAANGVNNEKPEKAKASRKEKAPDFFIQDREFENGRSKGLGDEGDAYFSDDMDDNSEFQSQAEKELYEALKKNNKGKAL